MEIPLGPEVLDLLDNAGMERVLTGHPTMDKLIAGCSSLRLSLLKNETKDQTPPLSTSTFWEITPKYRLDVLRYDIPKCLNQLAYAAAIAEVYVPFLRPPEPDYYPTIADAFFWYHIDMGTRMISSCWDRVALLLDIAFDLNLRKKCTLGNVLKRIKRRADNQEAYQKLIGFKESAFEEVEGGTSLGNRHEVTHLISPYARFFHEYLSEQSSAPGVVSIHERAHERIEFLRRHHQHLLEGVESAADLVLWKWPHKRDKDVD